MADQVLELQAVSKTFGQRVKTHVLHHIDLAIRAGEFAALVGPSGSGKSTLLNLMGLLERPSTGRVLVGGRDTSDMSDDELTAFRGRTIGFVFQFHHLLSAFSSLENVMLPAYAEKGRATESMKTRALDLIGRVGLASQAHKKASDMSGGQQQRIAIARSLMMAPSLLLADEPTGNLDTRTADEIFAMLREFNKRDGTALLVVTHDLRLAHRCDRIITLVDGRIESDEENSRPVTALDGAP